MRVVFDTNILALYFRGNPATAILEAALSGFPEEQLSFYYSEDMFQEYQDVLTRLSAQDPQTYALGSIAEVLAAIREHGHLVSSTIRLTPQDEGACSHEPDNRFLECALEANADYIVTVNTEHIPTDRDDIEIIGPGQFQMILFSD